MSEKNRRRERPTVGGQVLVVSRLAGSHEPSGVLSTSVELVLGTSNRLLKQILTIDTEEKEFSARPLFLFGPFLRADKERDTWTQNTLEDKTNTQSTEERMEKKEYRIQNTE